MTEQEFWNWFLTKKAQLEGFIVSTTRDDYSVYHELTDKLKSYQKLLVPEVTKNNDNYVLVLSCDGRREGIPHVQRLFDTAPLIDNWVIQKFRGPGHGMDKVNYRGLLAGPDDIKIKHDLDGHHYDIELFIKGYKENDERFKGLAFLCLDHFVGEYNVMTKIGHIQFKKLALFGGTKDKLSLREFRALIESLN
jgi:hypothetical protein